MRQKMELGSEELEISLQRVGDKARVHLGEEVFEARLSEGLAGEHRLVLDGKAYRIHLASRGDEVFVHALGRTHRLRLPDPYEAAAGAGGAGANAAVAPMPGMVVSVEVEAGQQVHDGQALMIIESMKLQTTIAAWRDGVVEEVLVAAGASFDQGARLVSLQAEEE